jgi:hypothetical protein
VAVEDVLDERQGEPGAAHLSGARGVLAVAVSAPGTIVLAIFAGSGFLAVSPALLGGAAQTGDSGRVPRVEEQQPLCYP